MTGKKKPRTFKAVLTDIDLNYIDSGLRRIIDEHEFTVYKFGKNHGNIYRLLLQAKRTRRKLEKVHYPPNGIPKLSAALKRLIRKSADSRSRTPVPEEKHG